MEENFVEQYQSEQKRQEAARKARLAKLGMVDSSDSETTPTSTARVRRQMAPQQRQNPQRPVQRPIQQNVQRTSQRPTDASTKQARENQWQMPSNSLRQRGQQQTGNPVITPEYVPQSAPIETGVNYSAEDEMFAKVSSQNSGATDANGDFIIARRPQQAQRVPQQRPVQQNAQRPQQTQRIPQQRPVQSQRPVQNVEPEDEMFRGNVSDNKSKSLMFGLTGNMEKPETQNNVDVINIRTRTNNPQQRSTRNNGNIQNKSKTGKYIGRFFFSLLSVIIALLITLECFLLIVAYGPSEAFRNQLVLMAEQASATKWVPYLAMSKSKVQEIIDSSNATIEDSVSLSDYTSQNKKDETGTSDGEPTVDKWANAKDGMIFEIVNKSTFKAYVLLVKDPSRVFVGTSTDDFDNATAGVDVFQAAANYGAVACINGGEFLDNGGHGSGYAPLGLTYSQGECVFDDGSIKTFMGITNDNQLIVRESMTRAEADELNIRDGVSFQTGNTLIERDGDNVKFHYQDGNTGTSQRSSIGQAADGTMILIVTDGRTASSPGATHNDMIKLMAEYNAVAAGMLDGGSSAMMYYQDWFTKYNADVSKLDQYQKQGLVNNYKAFTNPRKIPSFFMVSPLS